MGLRDLLWIPKRFRRTRSEVRPQICVTDDSNNIQNPEAPRLTESTPDLRIDASTLPKSDLLTSPEQEPKGIRTVLFIPGNLSNHLQRNAGRPESDQRQSIPTKGENESLEASDSAVKSGAISGAISNLKPLATSATKLLLRGVKESADAFPPLKSALGALCFILDNCEARTAPECNLLRGPYSCSRERWIAVKRSSR
jgi:hypothetical protein